jgi:hypothetical protein
MEKKKFRPLNTAILLVRTFFLHGFTQANLATFLYNTYITWQKNGHSNVLDELGDIQNKGKPVHLLRGRRDYL